MSKMAFQKACLTMTIGHSLTAATLLALLANSMLGQEQSVQTVDRTEPRNGTARANATNVEGLIAWLPESTESLVVVQGPVKLPSSSSVGTKSPRPSEEVTGRSAASNKSDHTPLQRPDCRERHLGSSLRIFQALGKSYVDYLREQPIRIVLRAGHFPKNEISAGAPYTGCTILMFEQSVEFRYADNSATQATIDEVSGQRVVRVDTEYQGEGKRTTYYCHPSPRTVIAATDRQFMQALLKRTIREGKVRALPTALPEWKFVNTLAPVWGVRHFSESSNKGAGAESTMVGGVTFSWEIGEEQSLVVRCVESKDIDQTGGGLSGAVRGFVGDHYPGRIVAPGVIEFRLPADSSSDFVTEGLMGYPIGS